jgi:hypothetical protein
MGSSRIAEHLRFETVPDFPAETEIRNKGLHVIPPRAFDPQVLLVSEKHFVKL